MPTDNEMLTELRAIAKRLGDKTLSDHLAKVEARRKSPRYYPEKYKYAPVKYARTKSVKVRYVDAGPLKPRQVPPED